MATAYVNGFLGGLLIGLAAVVLFRLNGRIMGVSGIASRLLWKPGKDFAWRLAFIVGLIGGGWIFQQAFAAEVTVRAGWPMVIAAGFLVGSGTVLANGCTSGHGICGIARLSRRSMAATGVFMLAGIMTVLIKKALGV